MFGALGYQSEREVNAKHTAALKLYSYQSHYICIYILYDVFFFYICSFPFLPYFKLYVYCNSILSLNIHSQKKKHFSASHTVYDCVCDK